jgi:UDP-N-acetylglucosamine 2-epimerase (non-hydrolysing)
MKKILFIFGTRPEAIKCAPVIRELQKSKSLFDVKVCVTGQHKEMLDQVLEFFQITPDYNLGIMTDTQTLAEVTSRVLVGLEPILENERPDLVMVQGDTTTAFAGALGAFYEHIPVAHIEAGLRTGDMKQPFPEELNRVMVSRIADYHLTPTAVSTANLRHEGVKEGSIFEVGNTIIDALLLAVEMVDKEADKYERRFSDVDFTKKVILVTAHRRENAGDGFVGICEALEEIANKYADRCEIVFPMHYSPAIRSVVEESSLSSLDNVKIIDPVDYPSLVYLMKKSYMILTDSGGIQEEAPSLGRPVLVMRETTERPEGVEAGVSKLVGTDPVVIIDETSKLIEDEVAYRKMAAATNPYGDGKASKRIREILKGKL